MQESLQELVMRLATEMYAKNEARLKVAGLTDEQNKDMRMVNRLSIVSFVKFNLKLDTEEAQRIVDTEILGTRH